MKRKDRDGKMCMYKVTTDARIKVTAVAQTMGDIKASWLAC